MIPRVMNFFWGGSQMSWMRWMTLASFRHWNPDWKMRLHQPSCSCSPKSWRSHEMEDGDWQGRDHHGDLHDLGIEQLIWHPPLPNLTAAHACDLFEWELLSTEGGWYSDMDILYTRPMDYACQEVYASDAVLCLVKRDIAVGFLAASENCSLFSAVLEQALRCYRPEMYQCVGTEAIYRTAGIWPVNLLNDPDTNDRAIANLKRSQPHLCVNLLPSDTVYMHDWTTASRLYSGQEELPKGAIGVHWFGGLTASQDCNRKWTRENYSAHPCTFTRYARMSCT